MVEKFFGIWRSSKMVALVAVTAAVFAALLIPFKAIMIIPGAAEVRIGTVIPVVFGLLFGPAGAWGAAIGNLIGDFFGTLGPGSIFGFFANFLLAAVPWALWTKLVRREPRMESPGQFGLLAVFSLIAAVGSAGFLSWGLDMLNLIPFAPLAVIVSINHAVAPIVLGGLLARALYPRIKRWGLYYEDIMSEELGIRSASAGSAASGWLLALACVGIFVVGLALSLGMYDSAVGAAGFGMGAKGQIGISLGLLPFVALIFLALIME